jgi:GNAT superfamily N-acetyltransferase
MMELTVFPVTSDRWPDLEKLFGANGAYAGCWCMWWRVRRSEFEHSTREERKAGLKALVDSEQAPGVLAYVEGQPVAWVSVAPRETYASLERSRTLRRIDEEPVWSIVCFFVAKPWRRKGLMVDLLRGVADYAAAQGATIVEGYPSDPPEGEEVQGGVTGFMGMASAFRKAGFVEVARPSPKRPIMRYYAS